MTAHTLPHHQPDDPGPDTDSFHPLRFEDSIAGRQTVWLNEVLVGEVAPNPGGRMQRASARLDLPHLPRKFWPASSLSSAKAIVHREFMEWSRRAGLHFVVEEGRR